MSLDQIKRYGMAALSLVVLVSVSINARSCYLASEWEDQVASSQAFAESALAEADSLQWYAAALAAEARVLDVKAQKATHVADSIATTLRNTRMEMERRIAELQQATPPDVSQLPAVVERDAIIEDLYRDNQKWEAAYATLKDSNGLLEASNEVLRLSGASLKAALYATTAAVDSLNAVLDARPGRTRWWVPGVGVGPSIGIGTDGAAYAGVGVNLSWSLPIG